MAMVEIKNLYKHFGPFTAVNDISFNVERGEVLGFLGPNGAGKSTTMKMITGFLAPDGGSVRVAGRDIADDSVAVKRLMGYLPEGAPAYPDMTPWAFLHFVGEIRGLKGSDLTRRVEQTVGEVNLEKVLYQPIETLSKGFKRRVGLAQAILHDPQVLILDEPTDGLDPNQKHEVRALIKAMAQEKVIVLSTHILEEVDAVCTRAVIIAAGKLIADGTPAQLEAQSPMHNSILVKLHGASGDTAAQGLGRLPNVSNVDVLHRDGDKITLQIYPKERQIIVGPVSDYLRQQPWHVDELHVMKGRLDEVFRAITAHRQSRT
jgi:ABC-2 type transport system ATP-binding protein